MIAFSGGADSLALAILLKEFASDRGVCLHASHIDHCADSTSAGRAEKARALAETLNLPSTVIKCDVSQLRRSGESLEMAARRIRYRTLDALADELGARYIATAHHLDDQIETVLLRIAYGQDLCALAGIPARRGRVVRPLLTVGRDDLRGVVQRANVEPAEDPANRDLTFTRNRIRHRVLPSLLDEEPELGGQLARLSEHVERANQKLAARFESLLEPVIDESRLEIARKRIDQLPPALLPYAIRFLSRRLGWARRPSARSLDTLAHQLKQGSGPGVDLGDGLRLETAGSRLVLRKATIRTARPTPFAYTLEAPGEVLLPEISSALSLRRGPVEAWMLQGAPHRVALTLSLGSEETLTVRTRLPGDSIQPLGSPFKKKLKEILIDRKVPARDRDRIPLLCRGRKVVWVPGVTIDHNARIQNESQVWIAEITTL